jgi:F-type H+-transporting ATPase subunit epsilon
MLPEKLDLDIVTPERRVIAETVDEVTLPGTEGYFGVRPGHAPMLTALHVGEITYTVGGKTSHLAVSGGYVEVLRDRVSVLAETAERAEEIDLGRAEKARDQAEEDLKGSGDTSRYKRAAVRLRRATTRIQVYGKRRGA